MDDLPFTRRLLNRFVGYIYAGLYISSDRLVIGASLLGWITLLLVILGGYFWLRTGEMAWFVGFLVILVLFRVAHWLAKRSGFIVFTKRADDHPPSSTEIIRAFLKFDLQASGMFSVTGREEYMFRRPSKLWRVPFGDHALMVERPSGSYLYQFIEDGHIQGIHPGCLVYGSQVNPALEIDFKTTWGPVAGETEFKWYAPRDKSEPKRYKRTMYLGFQETADRDAIWRSLLTRVLEEKEVEDDN